MMDLPYSQQQEARRKNRSAANLNHLTLAPLSTRLPLRGDDFDGTAIIESHAYFATASSSHNNNGNGVARSSSYIQGRSAPTTPRLLSKSPPARSTSRPRSAAGKESDSSTLIKSRSTTHLAHNNNGSDFHSAAVASGHVRHHRRHKTENGQGTVEGDDWLMRAAVLVTSETREFKGQSWLMTRASSTSLSGLRDAAEDLDAALFERELAREREHLEKMVGSASRHASRRGSVEQHDVLSPLVQSHRGSKANSRVHSRTNSRTHSRVGSRVQLFTPMESQHSHQRHNGDPSSGGYFEYSTAGIAEDEEGGPAGPDFVNLDEKLEAIELNQRDTSLEDEDHVRRLVKREKAGGVMGSWLGNAFSWSLLSAHETEGDTDEDEDDDEHGEEDADVEGGDVASSQQRRLQSRLSGAVGWSDKQGPAWASSSKDSRGKKVKRTRFEGDSASAAESPVPPPPKTDEGTWQDAAWLLSVASKVIL
ncbi:hypothetical protein F503_01520 [Ophiostoma piceae UAMH 11346]|uniref:Uncharacterized protein n=1 Tax=Ophiostoma piceae (strain UAMH 11346) TaxID=1262450 RepID=S3BPI3_OPHP1|nr:hypothetical protein F503_01520 [Ophiostoma piceae UAMH 11346]